MIDLLRPLPCTIAPIWSHQSVKWKWWKYPQQEDDDPHIPWLIIIIVYIYIWYMINYHIYIYYSYIYNHLNIPQPPKCRRNLSDHHQQRTDPKGCQAIWFRARDTSTLFTTLLKEKSFCKNARKMLDMLDIWELWKAISVIHGSGMIRLS